MIKRSAVTLAAAVILCHGVAAAGQTETVETDPIRCWWRTSAAGVRVGEPFSVVLTCAVVETDAVTVVPNQAELAPNALQLPPFDVLGGSHPNDLRTTDHRFFQYEYQVRLVSEDVFGKDVKLPPIRISYRVRSRIDAETVEGRDQSYLLPPASVRVVSLVPADATDIRDSSLDTFDTIDRRLSRANVLRVVGGLLIGFAAVAALIAVVRAAGGARGRAPVARSLVSDGAILRQIGRELAAIQQARRGDGWTADLIARLLTAVRILGGYALDLPATPVAGDVDTIETAYTMAGRLTVRGRGLRGDDVMVPGWVTANVIAQRLGHLPPAGGSVTARPRHPRILEALEPVLARLTTAQYGREQTVDDAAIDDALASAVRALRRLKVEQLWIVRKLQALRSPRRGKRATESKAWFR
jgi:hypothetical protein